MPCGRAQRVGSFRCWLRQEEDPLAVLNWAGRTNPGERSLRRLVLFDIDNTLISIGSGNSRSGGL